MNILLNHNPKMLPWLPVLLSMVLIFFLSSQTAKESNQLSKNIAQSTIIAGERIGIVAPGAGKSGVHLDRWNNLLRDCAHAAVFFVLALAVSNAVRESGLEGVKKYLFIFIFCGLYAVLDEFHQSFVPGRGAQVSDFFRDCGGVILGMVICSLPRLLHCTEAVNHVKND